MAWLFCSRLLIGIFLVFFWNNNYNGNQGWEKNASWNLTKAPLAFKARGHCLTSKFCIAFMLKIFGWFWLFTPIGFERRWCQVSIFSFSLKLSDIRVWIFQSQKTCRKFFILCYFWSFSIHLSTTQIKLVQTQKQQRAPILFAWRIL